MSAEELAAATDSLSQGAKGFLAGQHRRTNQLKLHLEQTSDFSIIPREFFGGQVIFNFFLIAAYLNA